MSARQVTYSAVVCDGCGVESPHLAKFVAQTREMTARDGWTHERVIHTRANWRQQVDLCPSCSREKKT